MSKYYHPLEKSVNAVVYKGVEFEVVERPDVLWVGCVDFAADNTGESDIGGTLKRTNTSVHWRVRRKKTDTCKILIST